MTTVAPMDARGNACRGVAVSRQPDVHRSSMFQMDFERMLSDASTISLQGLVDPWISLQWSAASNSTKEEIGIRRRLRQHSNYSCVVRNMSSSQRSQLRIVKKEANKIARCRKSLVDSSNAMVVVPDARIGLLSPVVLSWCPLSVAVWRHLT